MLTIKKFENALKAIQKRINACDCYAAAQPFIRIKHSLNAVLLGAGKYTERIVSLEDNFKETTSKLNKYKCISAAVIAIAKQNLKKNAELYDKIVSEYSTVNGSTEISRSTVINAKEMVYVAKQKLKNGKQGINKNISQLKSKIAENKLFIKAEKDALQQYLKSHSNLLNF